MSLSQPGEPRARLRWEIETVADRFRQLSEPQLAGPMAQPPLSSGTGAADRPRSHSARAIRAHPQVQSRAEHGVELAQRLAHAAAGVAARSTGRPQRAPDVPLVSAFAVGEQVAVTGHDLLAELDGVSDDDLVWFGDRRVRAIDAVISINEELRRLRLAL